MSQSCPEEDNKLRAKGNRAPALPGATAKPCEGRMISTKAERSGAFAPDMKKLGPGRSLSLEEDIRFWVEAKKLYWGVFSDRERPNSDRNHQPRKASRRSVAH